MELRQLKTFDAVVKAMNFTTAARELHFAQSTVSEQIQNLEKELGSRLFDRSNRQLVLTTEGKSLAEYANRIIALSDEAQRAVAEGGPSIQLSVGALETLTAYRLPNVLARYRVNQPDIRVSLKRGNRGELYSAVSRREMDLCLTFGAAPSKFGLHNEKLASEPLVVVAPVDHEYFGKGAAPVSRLLEEPFLVTPPGCGFREIYDNTFGLESHSNREPAMEVDSLDALGACVASGMGCALLPRVAVFDLVERGHVCMLEVSDMDLHVPVTMSWLEDASIRPHVSAFRRELGYEFAA
jgi:DNA-binding transcriptional LysR family regulator